MKLIVESKYHNVYGCLCFVLDDPESQRVYRLEETDDFPHRFECDLGNRSDVEGIASDLACEMYHEVHDSVLKESETSEYYYLRNRNKVPHLEVWC